jgi:hypothetical protein
LGKGLGIGNKGVSSNMNEWIVECEETLEKKRPWKPE